MKRREKLKKTTRDEKQKSCGIRKQREQSRICTEQVAFLGAKQHSEA